MKHTAIDIHSHVDFPDNFNIVKKRYSEEKIYTRFILPASGLRSSEINRGLVADLRDALRDGPKKIRDMEERKLGFTVLSATPFSFFYEIDEDLAIELARYQNDRMTELVQKHPDSFAGMATLPLQAPEASLKELGRALNLGLRGVEVGSHAGKRELGDRVFWPIYETLEKAGLPMVIHPHHVAGVERLQDYYLSNLIGNPLDSTIAAAYLMFSGVFERYPDFKVVLVHGGGQLPYIFGRLEHGHRVRPECRDNTQKSPREYLKKNFYFDIITHSQEALRYLISLVGSDRVLLGTDYPYDMGNHEPVDTVMAVPGISDGDRQKILRDNAVSLFRLNVTG